MEFAIIYECMCRVRCDLVSDWFQDGSDSVICIELFNSTLRGGYPTAMWPRSLQWKGFGYPSRWCGQPYRRARHMEQFFAYQRVIEAHPQIVGRHREVDKAGWQDLGDPVCEYAGRRRIQDLKVHSRESQEDTGKDLPQQLLLPVDADR